MPRQEGPLSRPVRAIQSRSPEDPSGIARGGQDQSGRELRPQFAGDLVPCDREAAFRPWPPAPRHPWAALPTGPSFRRR
jgi:hypothetical protein